MKQLLLHGAGTVNSRKNLSQLKEQFDPSNVVIFEGGVNISDVLGELATVSLLDENRLIIWENSPKELTIYKLPITNCQFILWFDYEVDVKKYSGYEVFFFPEEKEASVFPLLDLLGNRDSLAFLELEKRNRTSPNDTQYILTMVFYLLRSLVVTPKTAGDFIKKKNEKMRSNFHKDELINLYKSTLEIDFKIKSGLLEIPQAEFSLINLFTK